MPWLSGCGLRDVKRLKASIHFILCWANPRVRGFHCFLTIPDFPDSRKLEIVVIPNHLGWSQTNRENQECFYFHNASQISVMVGNHSGHLKLKFVLPRTSRVLACYHNQSSKLLCSSSPLPPTNKMVSVTQIWERFPAISAKSGMVGKQ